MSAIQERLSSLPLTRSGGLAKALNRTIGDQHRRGILLMDRPRAVAPAVVLPSVRNLTQSVLSVTVRDVTVRPHVPRAGHVPVLAKPKRFPVASIDFSKKDVGLPYGVPRRVTARTLKELAGGRRTDQLLKSTRSGWEFVPDSTMIDLSDNTVVFKVAGLTIFS